MICTAHLRNPEPRLTLSNNTSSADNLVTDKAAEKAISTSGFISYTLCILPPRSLSAVCLSSWRQSMPPRKGSPNSSPDVCLSPRSPVLLTSRTCVFRAEYRRAAERRSFEIISERKRERWQRLRERDERNKCQLLFCCLSQECKRVGAKQLLSEHADKHIHRAL